MIDRASIDNVAFHLSLAYIDNHHHMVRMENADSDEVRGWQRAAKFALEYRPSKTGGRVFTPPDSECAREQMAAWLSRHYLNRAELAEAYWARTRKPWMRVADAVMKSEPR